MPATVLVVDDDPYIRDALSDLLADEGYRVLLARDGSDALGILATERPCLILVDIMMPVMDGLTFIRHLESSVPYRSIPVAVMTAAAGKLPSRLARPVVPKPIEIHSLLELVRQHCEPESTTGEGPPISAAPGPDDDPDGFDCCGPRALFS